MDIIADQSESPLLQLRGIPAIETRISHRLTDRFVDRRGSTSDALLDFRSPRFENLDTVRRANLRIERRPTMGPTDALDLHTPRIDDSAPSILKPDLHVTDASSPRTAPLMARRSAGPSALASSPLRRETIRQSPRDEVAIVKGLDKEVLKLVEQEDQRRYERALSVLEASPDDSFALVDASPGKKRKKKADGKQDEAGPKQLLSRQMITDLLWSAGMFAAAFAVGLLLLRIERAIRALAQRESHAGKILRALWAWMFVSSRKPRW